MNREKMLDEAKRCVCTDRNHQYGNPEDNFSGIADFWTTYIKERCILGSEVKITSGDVANMMILFKVARAMTANEQKSDTYVDIAGYAACAAEIFSKENNHKIILASPHEATVTLLRMLESGEKNQNGDRTSDYLKIASNVAGDKFVSISLIENKLAIFGDWGYAIHIINDVDGTDCITLETEHMDENEVEEMIEKIIDNLNN